MGKKWMAEMWKATWQLKCEECKKNDVLVIRLNLVLKCRKYEEVYDSTEKDKNDKNDNEIYKSVDLIPKLKESYQW